VSEPGPEPRVFGVLVTYRRPTDLRASLAAIAGQDRTPDGLIVVDNSPGPANEHAVVSSMSVAHYVPAAENLGPAGAIAEGMRRILETAAARDWIVVFDDDDPPKDSRMLSTLASFAQERSERDPATGGVGLSGVRFDRRKGRVVRVPDDELHGAVSVDCFGGNQFPLYSVRAVQNVGPPRRDLFFGLEELEFGLRLRDAGYSLYGHGAMWYEGRAAQGRLGARVAPTISVAEPTWRRYYSLRNLILILRSIGRTRTAVRVTFVAGMAKPIANLPVHPRQALRNLLLNWRACRDAWTGRTGRTIEPGQS
jgi:GT2 family glycosyltransferase